MCQHDDCRHAITHEMVAGFAAMDTMERISFVRNALYALTSPSGRNNYLMKETTLLSQKRKRDDGDSAVQRTTTAYALRGRRVCLKAFAAVTQLSAETIRRHAREVSLMPAPLPYSTGKGTSRIGKYGIQRMIVRAFLIGIARDYGMECPRGRGSRDESPLRLLPSHFTKTKLHGTYSQYWDSLCDALLHMISRYTKPSTHVSFNLFIRYWHYDMPLLRIASTGSDFCDTCTTLRDTISSLPRSDVRVEAASGYLQQHLMEARTEFRLYKQYEEKALPTEKHHLRHFVFDFAEKVLLPRLQKQPGQLHFITGLKFDFFGVASSNDNATDIYSLVEGHWPQEKTANTVLSMLHHSISARSPEVVGNGLGPRLVLHADNCSGQNKNRFVIFYLLWRVLMGYEKEVSLLFLVAGHTKNACDGSFGHVKRKLRNTDAITPADMVEVVRSSSLSNTNVHCGSVHWRNWKQLLCQYFTVPSGFKISTAHVFSARASDPVLLFVKKLSTSETEMSFGFLNSGATVSNGDLSNASYDLGVTPLTEVTSKQHQTRYNYLKVNILDRYYPHNDSIRSAFFKDGAF